VLGEVHAEVDVEGGLAGEDGDAGVAGFFGGVPEAVVAIEFRGEGDLFLAGFGFLQAEDVGFFGGDEVSEAFAEDGADAFNVPGDEVLGWEGGLGIGDLRLGRREGDWIIGRVLNKEGRKGKGGLEIGDWRLEIGKRD
jgi:hypothetical protein